MTPEEFTEALASTRMPFGKFAGRLIYDLPLDYLVWFKQKGFPAGRIGVLMRAVCDAKGECGEAIFNPLRGEPYPAGRRGKKSRHWSFPAES